MKIQDLNSGQFLPGRNYSSIIQFTKNDTKALLDKNLTKQPADWRYRNLDVTYNINSRGYRAPDFQSVDWGNSIVLFGCSYTFGEGLPENDTISARLQAELGYPTINMGALGASIDFCHHNATILHAFYTPPKAVVFLWPAPNRCTVFYDDNWTGTVGLWNLHENKFMKYWFKNQHMQQMQQRLFQMSTQQIWQSSSIFYEASFFDSTVDILQCDKLNTIDYARDLQHPGHLTAEAVSKKIASELTTKGLL